MEAIDKMETKITDHDIFRINEIKEVLVINNKHFCF